MNVFEAIEKRYSYRGSFTEEKISKENLIKIVDAGIKAPSGKNLQTTQFIIVDDPETLDKIRKVLPDKPTITTCQALIACIIDREPDNIYHGYNFQLEDCAASVENMLLAITALGYASVWLDGVLRVAGKGRKIGDILNLPAEKKIQIVLPVGVPQSEGPKKVKLSFEERVWFNKYK